MMAVWNASQILNNDALISIQCEWLRLLCSQICNQSLARTCVISATADSQTLSEIHAVWSAASRSLLPLSCTILDRSERPM